MRLKWLVLVHLRYVSLVILVLYASFVCFQVLRAKYAKWCILEQFGALNGLHILEAKQMDEIEDQRRPLYQKFTPTHPISDCIPIIPAKPHALPLIYSTQLSKHMHIHPNHSHTQSAIIHTFIPHAFPSQISHMHFAFHHCTINQPHAPIIIQPTLHMHSSS